MRSLFSSSIANVIDLFVLARSFILAEIFTEAIRVYPKTLTLKPRQYARERGRAPEELLLIVATITEQVAYV